MDPEAGIRADLKSKLSGDFDCFEEAALQTERGDAIRADILAVPKAQEYRHLPLAFEVKLPKQRNFQNWTHVFRQAFDCVGAACKTRGLEGFIVAGAFVYPAPPYDPYGSGIADSEYWRPEQSAQLAGVIHMAAMLKVGTAQIITKKPNKGLNLQFGPNGVWREGFGWIPKAKEQLSSRRVGSRKVKSFHV